MLASWAALRRYLRVRRDSEYPNAFYRRAIPHIYDGVGMVPYRLHDPQNLVSGTFPSSTEKDFNSGLLIATSTFGVVLRPEVDGQA